MRALISHCHKGITNLNRHSGSEQFQYPYSQTKSQANTVLLGKGNWEFLKLLSILALVIHSVLRGLGFYASDNCVPWPEMPFVVHYKLIYSYTLLKRSKIQYS